MKLAPTELLLICTWPTTPS